VGGVLDGWWATSAAEAVDWSAELGAHSASLFLGQGLLG